MQQAFTKYIPINHTVQDLQQGREGSAINNNQRLNLQSIGGTCNSWISFLVLVCVLVWDPNLSLEPCMAFRSGFCLTALKKNQELGLRLPKSSLIHRLSSSRLRLSQTKPSANHFQYWKWYVLLWEWDQCQGRGCNTFVIHKLFFCWLRRRHWT